MRAIDLIVRWDPSLLDVASVGLSPGLQQNGWSITTDLTTPGVAIIGAWGAEPLTGGPLDILNIVADVPSTAGYGAAHAISFENVQLNAGQIATVGDAALHKVAFLGDVSGDANYLGMDPALIARVAAGLDGGFAMYRLTDPGILGDVDADGILSAMDASYVARKTVGLSEPTIPDLPPVLPPAPPVGPDPTLEIPSVAAASPGSDLTLPITVTDSAAGLHATLLRIAYDTGVFDVGTADARLGPLVSGLTGQESWSIQANVDDGTGTIVVLAYSAVPLSSGVGDLIEVDYHIRSDAPAGSTTLDLVQTDSYLNDGQLALTAVDGQIAIEAASATVVGRHIFYNNSSCDGADPAANAADDAAIAIDKQALLPGQTATFANYTSYQRGINGIMVDIEGLADPVAVGNDDFSEFIFRYGNDDTPGGWSTATSPVDVDVRDLGGGVHRVTFVWADNAVPNKNWLQVTVLADAATGLAENDVFYFGNTIGENTGNFAVDYADAFDVIWPLLFTPDAIGVDHPADINRDGRIDYSDVFDGVWPNLFAPAPLDPITPTAAPAAGSNQPTPSSTRPSPGRSNLSGSTRWTARPATRKKTKRTPWKQPPWTTFSRCTTRRRSRCPF